MVKLPLFFTDKLLFLKNRMIEIVFGQQLTQSVINVLDTLSKMKNVYFINQLFW